MLEHRFPEDFWPPQNWKDYLHKTKCGYDILSQSDIVMCGLARNIERGVSANLKRSTHLKTMCKSLRWIIYTNDNTDRTLDVIESYRTLQDVVIHEKLNKEFHGSVVSKSRYKDMSYYRNQYLPFIGGDYTIIIDWDIHGFSYDGVANSLYWINKLGCDGIGSNGLIYGDRRLYYDSLATVNGMTEEQKNLWQLNRGEDPIKVTSCFGGLMIYKTSSLKGKSYKDDECDHITINRELNVYVNPSMITLYSQNPYDNNINSL